MIRIYNEKTGNGYRIVVNLFCERKTIHWVLFEKSIKLTGFWFYENGDELVLAQTQGENEE